jgi:hypothetical protein|tara:strand:- start:1176 stop:1445 length:270 start_codon:yes stop_codon:yes gene_type:complete
MDFDGAIASLLSAATSLRGGGDHVAARGAEVCAVINSVKVDALLQALAMQTRGDRDVAQVAAARLQRDYASCEVPASVVACFVLYKDIL